MIFADVTEIPFFIRNLITMRLCRTGTRIFDSIETKVLQKRPLHPFYFQLVTDCLIVASQNKPVEPCGEDIQIPILGWLVEPCELDRLFGK